MTVQISIRLPNVEVNNLYESDTLDNFAQLFSLYDYTILFYYRKYIYAFRATFSVEQPFWTIDCILYYKIGNYVKILDIGGRPITVFKCLSIIGEAVGKLIVKINRRNKR